MTFRTWLCIVFVQVLSFQSGLSAEEVRPEVLIAAYREWKLDATFRATYEYFEFTAAVSDIDAFQSIVPTEPVAIGEFVKKGSEYKYSRIFPNGPSLAGSSEKNDPKQLVNALENEDGVAVSNLSWMSLWNDDIWLQYTIGFDRHLDHAVYTHRDSVAGVDSGGVKCFNPETEMSPLSPIIGCFDGLPAEPPERSTWTIVASEDGDDFVTMSRSVSRPSGSTASVEAVFWLAPTFPVLTNIKQTLHNPRVEYDAIIEAKMSEWVKCGSYDVPSHVISVLSHSDGSFRLIRVWRSKDLTGENVSDDLLTLAIPETTTIMGLKDSPAKGQSRILSLAGIKADSIDFPEDELNDVEMHQEFQRRIFPRHILILLVTIGLGIGLAVARALSNRKGSQ